MSIEIGSRVVFGSDKRVGEVRFIGTTEFAAGNKLYYQY
jgi:hypothetical protein